MAGRVSGLHSLHLYCLYSARLRQRAPGPSKVSVAGLLVISPPATTLTLGVTAAVPGTACWSGPAGAGARRDCVSLSTEYLHEAGCWTPLISVTEFDFKNAHKGLTG